MNIEIIEKMISNCKNENIEKWNYLKELLTNNTVKIKRNKNEFDIISPAAELEKIQLTNYYNNEAVSHVRFDIDREKQIDSLVLEYFYDIEDYKILEIIEG